MLFSTEDDSFSTGEVLFTLSNKATCTEAISAQYVGVEEIPVGSSSCLANSSPTTREHVDEHAVETDSFDALLSDCFPSFC